MMDNDTLHAPERVQAEDHLRRFTQVKKRIDGAALRRLAGGVIVLIGVIALIGFFVAGNHVVAIIATACLCAGGLVGRRGAHLSIHTFTESITDALAWFEELEEQPGEG